MSQPRSDDPLECEGRGHMHLDFYAPTKENWNLQVLVIKGLIRELKRTNGGLELHHWQQ